MMDPNLFKNEKYLYESSEEKAVEGAVVMY